MAPTLALFALATLGPATLIALGSIWGGWWIAAALLWLTVLTASIDEIVASAIPASVNTRGADGLSLALVATHFSLLALAVTTLAGDTLGPLEKLGLFAAAGLFFGQVSNANAHELIHRGSRLLHRAGMWVYISLLFGHHTSAHVLVHHRHVATRDDPNTARLGESFYRFAWRAWKGSFRAGYRAESARLAAVGRSKWAHPYWVYFAGAGLMICTSALLAGPKGLIAYLCLAGFAQTQLHMSDYVQHYGLKRSLGSNGKPEPTGDRHSWNSPHAASSALMLNAPRHGDHHAHPGRAYLGLTIPNAGPMLPRALPVMACLALSPKHWRNVMDPRAKAWAAPE